MITIVNIAICDSEEHCNAHQKNHIMTTMANNFIFRGGI
jgi:hypothetical protein